MCVLEIYENGFSDDPKITGIRGGQFNGNFWSILMEF